MEGLYEVTCGKTVVGKVQLVQQGLYYHVTCRCHLPDEQVYRLYTVQDGCRENIGVVIPEGDGGALNKKIPAKKLTPQNLCFILSAGETSVSGKFVPVSPEEPFLYIDRLKTAFLQSDHGKSELIFKKTPKQCNCFGVCVRYQVPDQQDNGQNRRCHCGWVLR